MELTLRTFDAGDRVDRPRAARGDVEAALAGGHEVIWIDIVQPDRPALDWLAALLHLHPVAVTEAVETHTRPRLSRYEHHVYLNCYLLGLTPRTAEVRATDVSVFMTEQVFVTLRRHNTDVVDKMLEREETHRDLVAHGPAALLWLLLDLAVDSHFDAVQTLDQRPDELEDQIFGSRPVARLQRETFVLRKDLLRIRRLTLPMREIASSILRNEALDGSLSPYFADVYDHTLRVGEWVDSARDILTSLLDAHLTIQSNRMNLVMKQVTSWAAIIAVPTLITGFFGQNVAFWGYGSGWGTLISLGLIAVSAGVLYWLFKRNDWL
ncbi:MAG: magnesium transporter CorA family protein [Pseudoclavibacter sp.]